MGIANSPMLFLQWLSSQNANIANRLRIVSPRCLRDSFGYFIGGFSTCVRRSVFLQESSLRLVRPFSMRILAL